MNRKTPLILAVAVLLLLVPACHMIPQTPEQAAHRIEQFEQAVDQTSAAIVAAQAKRNDLVDLIEQLPEGQTRDRLVETVDAISRQISEHAYILTEAQQALREARAATANATDWGPIVGGVGGVVTPFLPPPWNAVAGGLVAIAATLLGWRKGKQQGDANAVQIAASIEAARKQNPTLDRAMSEAKSTLASYQTDEQHRLVNRAQHKLA